MIFSFLEYITGHEDPAIRVSVMSMVHLLSPEKSLAPISRSVLTAELPGANRIYFSFSHQQVGL